MKSGLSVVSALVGGLLAAACEGRLPAPDEGGEIRASAEPPLRTSATVYKLESDGFNWTAEIPFTYENRTADPWFLVNCNEAYTFRLEKRVGDGWKLAYVPELNQCLSPAIRIDVHETLTDTLRVSAGFPGNDFHPKFEVADPEGTYRIVLETRSSFDPDDTVTPPYFGPFLPLEQRVSNAFELRVAEPPARGP